MYHFHVHHCKHQSPHDLSLFSCYTDRMSLVKVWKKDEAILLSWLSLRSIYISTNKSMQMGVKSPKPHSYISANGSRCITTCICVYAFG